MGKLYVLLFTTGWAFAVCFGAEAFAISRRGLPIVQTSDGVYLSAVRSDESRVFLQRAKVKIGENRAVVAGGFIHEIIIEPIGNAQRWRAGCYLQGTR